MSEIERELSEGEQVVLIGRVSWWTLVPRSLVALAVLVVLVGSAARANLLSPIAWLVALGVTLFVWLVLAWELLVRVVFTQIAITDRRVISRHGALATVVKTTPLGKINNVNVRQSVFGNFFDYGDIEITTATAEERDNHFVRALAHPAKFRNALTDSVER